MAPFLHEGIEDGLRVGVGLVGDEGVARDFEGVAEGIEGGGVGAQEGFLEERLARGVVGDVTGVGAGVDGGGFPGPVVQDLTAQAGDAAVDARVYLDGFRAEILQEDGDEGGGLRGAGEARRAVGIGCAGGAVEAGAVRVERIVDADGRELVGARGVDLNGLALEVGFRVVEGEIAEGGDAVGEVILDVSEPVFTVRFTLAGVLILVEIGEELRIGRAVRRRRNRGEGERAVERAEEVGRGCCADTERGINTDRGASVEGTAEGVEAGGSLGGVIGVAGVGAAAVGDRVALEKIEGGEPTAFAAGEFAAGGQSRLEVAPVTVFRDAPAIAQLGAAEIAAGNVVDDAGDGIGTVDGGSAVAEDVDALNALGGELVDVGVEGGDAAVVGGDGVRGEAAAVEEDERVAGADTAEVDVGVVAAGVGAAVLGFVERDVRHLREGGEHLNGREGIADLDLLDVENGDGEDPFLIEALNIGAGDGEGLEFQDVLFGVFFLGGGRGGSGRGLGGQCRRGECGQEAEQGAGAERAGGCGRHRGWKHLQYREPVWLVLSGGPVFLMANYDTCKLSEVGCETILEISRSRVKGLHPLPAHSTSCHRDGRSDVALHLEFELPCHALVPRARDDKQDGEAVPRRCRRARKTAARR